MAFVKIEHVSTNTVYYLPRPSLYGVRTVDIDKDSDRAGGYLIRNRIREDVYKVQIGWEGIKAIEISEILKAIAPAKVRTTFFAPEEGFYHTADMYASDRDMELVSCTNENEPEKADWNLSFSLVEF